MTTLKRIAHEYHNSSKNFILSRGQVQEVRKLPEHDYIVEQHDHLDQIGRRDDRTRPPRTIEIQDRAGSSY